MADSAVQRVYIGIWDIPDASAAKESGVGNMYAIELSGYHQSLTLLKIPT